MSSSSRHIGMGSSRRRTGRMLQELLQCDLGEILDLSGGGMRVQTRKPPKIDEMTLRMVSSVGEFDVRARVRWTRRSGLLRTDVGLEFIDLDDDTRRTLSEVYTAHRRIDEHAA